MTFFTVFTVLGAIILGWFGYMRFVKPVKAYESALDIMKSYRSASFEILYGMDIKMEITDYGTENIDMYIEGDGAIDIDENQLYMELTMEIMDEEVTITEVIDSEDMYIKIDDEDYQKISLAELEQFGGMSFEDMMDNQLWDEIPPERAYEYKGEEVIDGKDAYVFQLSLIEDDIENITEAFNKDFVEAMNTASGGALDLSEEDVSIGEIKYTQWIDKSDSMPIKEKIVIDEISVSLGEFGSVSMNNLDIEITYSDVNQPVEIEVPEVQL